MTYCVVEHNHGAGVLPWLLVWTRLLALHTRCVTLGIRDDQRRQDVSPGAQVEETELPEDGACFPRGHGRSQGVTTTGAPCAPRIPLCMLVAGSTMARCPRTWQASSQARAWLVRGRLWGEGHKAPTTRHREASESSAEMAEAPGAGAVPGVQASAGGSRPKSP